AALQVVLVSRGDAEANRRKVAEFGLTFRGGLQRQWEISKLYGMFATPVAYLIDEQGTIAAEAAVGVEPILGLLTGVESPTGAAQGGPRPRGRPARLAGDGRRVGEGRRRHQRCVRQLLQAVPRGRRAEPLPAGLPILPGHPHALRHERIQPGLLRWRLLRR